MTAAPLSHLQWLGSGQGLRSCVVGSQPAGPAAGERRDGREGHRDNALGPNGPPCPSQSSLACETRAERLTPGFRAMHKWRGSVFEPKQKWAFGRQRLAAFRASPGRA